jgi:hypothetical protein
MDEKYHPGRVIILVYLGTLTHRIINQKGGFEHCSNVEWQVMVCHSHLAHIQSVGSRECPRIIQQPCFISFTGLRKTLQKNTSFHAQSMT